MSKLSLTVLAMIAAMGLTAGTANAELLAYEPFSESVYTDGSTIEGLDGGIGWSGSWVGSSTNLAAPGKAKAATPGATYPGLVSSGLKAVRPNDTDANDRFEDRFLSAGTLGADGTTAWVTLIYKSGSPFRLMNGTSEVVMIDKVDDYGDKYRVWVNGTNYGTGPSTGGVDMALIKFDFAAGNDTIKFWLGSVRDITSEATLGSATKTVTDQDVMFDGVRLAFGGYADTIFDEIRVATTFSDAVSATDIPEPASFALLGLGGLLALSRRRNA